MKRIITHKNPDLDALTSVWLIRRFLPGWDKAKIEFVLAGQALDDSPVDADPEILHVDTGGGRLDHHQFKDMTSAAELTLGYILEKKRAEKLSPLMEEALERIVSIVTAIDNGCDLAWPEASTDRYEFSLNNLIYGIKRNIPDDNELVEQGLILLEGLLRSFKDKIRAEEKIDQEGIKFETPWGKAIACETGNEKVLWEAEIKGFMVVVKFDPRSSKRVKIYSRFDSKVDLTGVYVKLKKVDFRADWFLHASKKLLLISKRPGAEGTSLRLEEIIGLLKKG